MLFFNIKKTIYSIYTNTNMSEATEEPKSAGPETKAQLVQYIKSWIEVDNNMRNLQKEMKTLRDN